MERPRILVVDDEPTNRHLIGEFLENLEYELDYAEDGAVAWAMLEKPSARYDLVILDRMMPRLDGMELLRRVKAEARFSRLPVIMQTAAAGASQVREGIEAGAWYYLTKPFAPEALRTLVRAALRDRELPVALDGLTARLRLVQEARYSIRTINEAQDVAAVLSQLCARSEATAIGLVELLVNAIEHGNLGITYAEKSRLRRENTWEAEVARRLALPENRDKRVTLQFERSARDAHFTVIDRGPGFDWRRFLELDPGRAFDPNGRGIALARRISFSRLEYRHPGNVVIATASLADEARDAAAAEARPATATL